MRLFLDVFVLVPCAVSGALLPFTAVPVLYAVVLLAVALLAAVDLAATLRRTGR
ncbi:hypothetical protein [Blastococcus litoris]|uniref:hypothetical protein n=1 Tax=Blastococcus litoris TaxID=2171622 RepID=UPI0013E019D2|nr:hypothetical protein [Blastococcus litoris]